jgi:hypothetical protein
MHSLVSAIASSFGASSTPTFGDSSNPSFGFERISFYGRHGISMRRSGKKKLKVKGCRHNPHKKSTLQCVCCRKNGHEAKTCKIPWEKINDKQGKEPEYSHYIVSHCNIGLTKDLCNTSYTSWRDAWLLDMGATSHVTL